MKVERLDVYDFKLHLTAYEFANLMKHSNIAGISLEVVLQIMIEDGLDEMFQGKSRKE